MQERKEINLTYFEGIEIYPKEIPVTINIDDSNQCITINPRNTTTNSVHVKYTQLVDCASVHNEMITEKDKSVLGRAIVGGILTGGLGAIIGGMSGIGSKKKVKKTHYLVINYRSKDNDIKVLSFRMDGLVNLAEFIFTLKNRINQNMGYSNLTTETYL